MTGGRAQSGGELELVLGKVLLVGSTASTIILAAGLVLVLAWPSMAAGDWLLRAGLIVLMATPALRVLVSVIEYTRSGEWLFAALTATVLLVLAGSLGVALLK